jgi:hypothetical protein
MSTLKIAESGGIAVVTFARPPVNAMDASSLEELASTFDRLSGDKGVKAIVLTGDGSAFSAGRAYGITPLQWVRAATADSPPAEAISANTRAAAPCTFAPIEGYRLRPRLNRSCREMDRPGRRRRAFCAKSLTVGVGG